jgi:hypothetical protein
LAFGCSKTDFPGWEFLFSIIESHPLSKTEKPHPLPGAPPKDKFKTKKNLLKWNYLSRSCRFNYVCRFWRLLPKVLPFEEWRAIWKEESKGCCTKTWESKEESLKTLWKTRKAIEEKLIPIQEITYCGFVEDIELYIDGADLMLNPIIS